jgi:hypothetical protein
MIYFIYQQQRMKKTPEEFRNWIEKKIEIEFVEKEKIPTQVGQFWRYYE